MQKNMDAKPLCIRFDREKGVIKIYNGIRYLQLFNLYSVINDRINSRKSNGNFDRIKHLISKKVVLQIVHHNFARIRINSFIFLYL